MKTSGPSHGRCGSMVTRHLPVLRRWPLVLPLVLTACGIPERLDMIGKTPPLTPIENPVAAPGYQPVSLPIRSPTTIPG